MSQAIKNAIAIIEKAGQEVAEELKGFEGLRINANTVFTRLVGAMKHASGIQLDPASVVVRSEVLTHVLGKPIKSAVTAPAVSTEPTDKAKTDFQVLVAAGVNDLLMMSAKEYKIAHEDLVIRGVAKSIGMDVTAADPAKITHAFIETMQAKLEQDNAKLLIAAIATGKSGLEKDLEQEEENKKIIAAPAADAKEGLPATPNMIDHVVTEQDLIDNPDLIAKGVTIGETIQIPRLEPLIPTTPPAPPAPAVAKTVTDPAKTEIKAETKKK